MADLRFEDHGSVVLLQPLSARGRDWVEEWVNYEPWQVMGTAVACDWRLGRELSLIAGDYDLAVEAPWFEEA